MNYTKEKFLILTFMLWIILIIPANAWMSGWSNRLVINVTNPNLHINFTNYQVNVTLSTSNFNFSKTNTTGSDIRFTLVNDSIEQHLSFWIESWNASGSDGFATVWVKVPFLNISTTEKIYMYYGNVSAMGESNPINTFGESSANLSIPGCALNEPCIVSSSQTITSSGNYGHPYIRINPGITLSISGRNTIVYFNDTKRFDVFGTIVSTAGGAPNGTNGGMYYGRGSGGEGGRGNNEGVPGGSFGGGGSGKGGCDPLGTVGGSFGGGGGSSWGDGCFGGGGGTGAFLSINATTLNIKTGGSIVVGTVNYASCPDGGGGALLQLLNISTLMFNGIITVTAGSGDHCYIGEGGGGGALLYLNNYSTTAGSGTLRVQSGIAFLTATGGIATLNIQDSSLSSAAGGVVTQQFSIDGSEPYVQLFSFDELEYSTSVQPTPVEIGDTTTIRLNYTYISNSSLVTSADVNLTVFDTTSSHAILLENIQMAYIPSVGLWQYNYTLLTGVNGTYKYNVKGRVSGLYGSDFDVNGTFDTKDTTPPQISGQSVATACSGYPSYRLANSPFEVTFSATDNWQIDQNSSFCNFTMSNYTSVISQITTTNNNCSFPSVGPAGSATIRILVNDTVNNTASATLGITVVDSCPVQPTQTLSTSSASSGGGGGGGGGGGSSIIGSVAISEELPEIIFENRALSLVQEQPERVKITLKNPKNEPLRVTLDGPSEVSFDEKEFTLSPGGEKDVYATFSYLTAGEYKPMISAQLGDLKRMYDLSVTVVKKEADAVEQLLIDAQKAVNSLILLKYKACENDVNAVKGKAIAIETLAGDIRSASLLSKGTTPSAAKIEELKLELSALSRFTDKIEECKPTVIIQQKSTVNEDGGVQTSKKAGNLIPVMAILVLLFGFGLFRFLGKV